MSLTPSFKAQPWHALRYLLLASLVFALPVILTAQALRVQQQRLRPRPQLVCILCSLTVSASPTSTSFTLVQGGVSTASSPIVIVTTLTGVSALSSLSLYGYFSSSTAALTDGATAPNNIPSSAVLGKMPTGTPTSFTPFTGTNPVGTAGAGLLLYSTSSLLTLGCFPASCRTDTLNLEINLGSLPQLPAGTYHGTLLLQAQAL
jgi:hypothetical protein